MSDSLRKWKSEVLKNHRWNTTITILDGAFFFFGLGFVFEITILPLFISKLTPYKSVVGLVPALWMLGFFGPQIISARLVEPLARKKRLVFLVGMGQRLPWLFLALATYFFIRAGSLVGLLLFFFLYGCYAFSGGFSFVPWLDLMGKVLLPKKRGRVLGFNRLAGGTLGIAGALVAGRILGHLPFPNNFSLCFLLAFLMTSISLTVFSFYREPDYPVVKKRVAWKVYFKGLGRILRENKNYSYCLLANIILCFVAMATPFYALYGIEKLGAPEGWIGRFTALILGAQTITFVLWGYLGDRQGYKGVMVLAALFAGGAAVLALLAESIGLYLLVFVLLGFYTSAVMLGYMNIVLEFSPPEERATYIGLGHTILALPLTIAPLLGGLLIDRIGYRFVFGLTALVAFVGLSILILVVKEPRRHYSFFNTDGRG
ncbi:MFS transporter [bacterium]|nr:MFS transporter [bacterium]MCG2677322.1 MFS transporter [bacterium]